jgi:hypothetical protein
MNISKKPWTKEQVTRYLAVGLFFLEVTFTLPTVLSVNAQIRVDTGNIANNAVTSPKIEDGQVRTPDIANNAVTTSKISDGAIETRDLADNSVTSEKIADGSITASDLAFSSTSANQKLIGATTVIFNTCSIDFSSIRAHQLVFAFCPVPGVRIGDKVLVTNQDLALDLLTQSASVNGTDIVRVAVLNPNSYPGDPAKITWAMIIYRT